MDSNAKLIQLALQEDLGKGDITSQALFGKKKIKATAQLVTREPLILAGIDLAKSIFKKIDPQVQFKILQKDGKACDEATVLAEVKGSVSGILAAERTALNFLQQLSGVATLTHLFVKSIAGTSAKILDTRKTLPGWRTLQKYAVQMGGGVNHRFGLYDAYLIKDNHLAAAGSVTQAVELARKHRGKKKTKIEIEVDTLEQFEEALLAKPDIILLDNMPLEDMHLAVLHCHKLEKSKRPLLEASGSVNLGNVRAIAQTGVDYISIGALTHSAPAVDIGLDFGA